MLFSEKLYELRKSVGWSQEEVANKISVSRQTISKWENGQSSPEMDKLPLIAQLYNVSLDQLVMPIEGALELGGETGFKDIQSAVIEKDSSSQRLRKIFYFLLTIFITIFFFYGVGYVIGKAIGYL